jgi:hypothetical protein
MQAKDTPYGFFMISRFVVVSAPITAIARYTVEGSPARVRSPHHAAARTKSPIDGFSRQMSKIE